MAASGRTEVASDVVWEHLSSSSTSDPNLMILALMVSQRWSQHDGDDDGLRDLSHKRLRQLRWARALRASQIYCALSELTKTHFNLTGRRTIKYFHRLLFIIFTRSTANAVERPSLANFCALSELRKTHFNLSLNTNFLPWSHIRRQNFDLVCLLRLAFLCCKYGIYVRSDQWKILFLLSKQKKK